MIRYLVIMKGTIPCPIAFNRTLKVTIRKRKITIMLVTVTSTIMVMMIINKRTLNNNYRKNKEQNSIMVIRMVIMIISKIPMMEITPISPIIRVTTMIIRVTTMRTVLEFLVWVSI